MFESVTKRRKNPIVNIFGWSLLFLVCLVFIFVGFSPDSSILGSGGAAAEVNSDAISLRDYKELLDRLDSNKQAPSDRDSQIKLQQDAINILVSRSLIVQEAEKLNIHVSDSEVAQALLEIEPFFEDGVFSRLRYKTYLRQARLTESEFEDKIRRDLIIQKMSNLIGYAGKDLNLVDEFDDKIDLAQINIAYAQLNPNTLNLTFSAAETPEYLSKNEAEIKKYYETHKSEFTTEEQVKARHILFKADEATPAGMEKALAKAQEIGKELTLKNFSDMARKYSNDPGSQAKGGELGLFSRGKMVPEFEAAAFSAEIGTISEPIKTQFGYHIILVDDKTQASEKTFDEVKSQIAQKLLAKESFDKIVSSLNQSLKNKNYEEIEELFAKNQIKWNTTGFFSITNESVPGVGNSKEFLDLSLSLSVDKEYPDQLVYQGDNVYMLKFKGARIDNSPNKNTQMDFFKQLMKQQKMNSLVQNWSDSLKEKASVKINPDLIR